LNLQRLLLPLTPLYAAGLARKNGRYDRGEARVDRLRRPVISVGNLSVGGAGKTPVVMRLLELLREQGITADVLSRGYGRNGHGVARVKEDGTAAEFGDEPLLIAAETHAPVYVGASRYQAGLLAEREAEQPRVHVLDDGFQHRRLARDLDVVVLHASDFKEALLPAGRLREPLDALARAHVLVLREEDVHSAAELKRRNLLQPIWRMRRTVTVPACGRAIAFCGIARPGEFFASLDTQGVNTGARIAFRDHRAYSAADVNRLRKARREHGCDGFLTTAKDWVRLSPEQRAALAADGALGVVGLSVEFDDEDAVRARLAAVAMRK
jgi:tetraacyldisaccharide 4'-kinase